MSTNITNTNELPTATPTLPTPPVSTPSTPAISPTPSVPTTPLPPTTIVVTSTSPITSISTPSSSTSTKAPTTSPTTSTATSPPSTSTTAPPQQTTLIVTYTPTSDGTTLNPVTVIQTITSTPPTTSSSSTTSSSTITPDLAGDTNSNGTTTSAGLSGGGKTAVEVIVPIVGVALLVLAVLWFWRRRKQQKDAEEIRRKEVEEYGYNPNEDPTLPPVGVMKPTGDGPFEMQEDGAGYRGWGSTAAGSAGRKASTNPSSLPVGMAYSEGTSPSQGPISDARSGDTLIGSPTGGRPISNGSEEMLGAMGPSAAGNRGGDMHRGPSNASSSYSAANRSDASGEGALPGGAYGAAQYYTGDANYGGPYADQTYGSSPPGRAEMSGQPVIRDNLARRATRIENPSHFPTQASAGISQNF